MKNIKLTLGMFALVTGAVGAFAFAPNPVKTGQSTGDYYVDSSGNPTTLVDPAHPCQNISGPLCSATFVIANGQPVPGTATNPRIGPKL